MEQVVDGAPELLDRFGDRLERVRSAERAEQVADIGSTLCHGRTVAAHQAWESAYASMGSQEHTRLRSP